ncbi:1-acyl-sn-glycerol-3-phosphate acyltransferase [Mucilaginibacter mali]|uniref:1-acyl-sn-glycerol-3-phosphate acyltransferase n=1 Tax=Mucilaginibacter mali TaxID=2740462 RepID=A0A7D4QED9_9SPHI|nr:lysophospholipid acyltransferase family protein [Mucilaginibacter mali]QKJ29632.1 1-acyl-sn-glycerol-3-phosphate acyltransferase [Mucilaginibacter mali]
MIKLLRKIHRYFLVFSMALFFFLLWPPLKYFSLKPGRYRGMIWLRKWWAFCSSALAGIFYRFTYEEKIDWSRTYIICPNHASNLDISAMSIMLGHTNCCFMGKANLKDNLITGIYFRTVDLPVDRDSKISSYRAFKAAAEKLQNGINMILFPEGGTADIYPPTVTEFKNGPFRLAIELKIQIIPVTSLNTWQVLWDDGAIHGSRPGICDVYVHKPIETAHLSVDDADMLKDRVFDIINNKMQQG